MAFDIRDKKLIETLSSSDGLNEIINWLSGKTQNHHYINRLDDGTILIQSKVWSSSDGINFKLENNNYTNTIGINKDSLYVNPTLDKNRINITIELKNFLFDIPSIVRNKRIEQII